MTASLPSPSARLGQRASIREVDLSLRSRASRSCQSEPREAREEWGNAWANVVDEILLGTQRVNLSDQRNTEILDEVWSQMFQLLQDSGVLSCCLSISLLSF